MNTNKTEEIKVPKAKHGYPNFQNLWSDPRNLREFENEPLIFPMIYPGTALLTRQ